MFFLQCSIKAADLAARGGLWVLEANNVWNASALSTCFCLAILASGCAASARRRRGGQLLHRCSHHHRRPLLRGSAERHDLHLLHLHPCGKVRSSLCNLASFCLISLNNCATLSLTQSAAADRMCFANMFFLFAREQQPSCGIYSFVGFLSFLLIPDEKNVFFLIAKRLRAKIESPVQLYTGGYLIKNFIRFHIWGIYKKCDR